MLRAELVHNELMIIIIIRRQTGFNLSYCHKKNDLRKFIICPTRICKTGEPHRRLSNAKSKNKCALKIKESQGVLSPVFC